MAKRVNKFVSKEISLQEAINNWKKALADYQNLERRIKEEREQWVKLANKDLIEELLPILDTLVSAQNHVKDEGVELGVKQFLAVLEKEGVSQIKTIGETFNPNTMECVSAVEGEDGKVIEEVRRGFMLKGQVLRPAQVVSGKEKGDYM